MRGKNTNKFYSTVNNYIAKVSKHNTYARFRVTLSCIYQY